eukprot:9167538-Alexandrium_andersonii.AAC.1
MPSLCGLICFDATRRACASLDWDGTTRALTGGASPALPAPWEARALVRPWDPAPACAVPRLRGPGPQVRVVARCSAHGSPGVRGESAVASPGSRFPRFPRLALPCTRFIPFHTVPSGFPLVWVCVVPIEARSHGLLHPSAWLPSAQYR